MAQQQQGKVRFVRVRGRIVPIRDKGYKGDKHRDYKATAALGAAAGAASGAGIVLSKSRNKFAIGASLAASGVGLGLGIGTTIKGIVRTVQQKKGKRARTFFGHYFAGGAGQLGGIAGGIGVAAAAVYGRRGISKLLTRR